MNTTIQIKHSMTSNVKPTATSMANGELALNATNQKLFFKNGDGGISFFSANTREPLLGYDSNVTINRKYFFVRSDANGDFTGSANTVANAFSTIQQAINHVACNLDLRWTHEIIIYVAPGTYGRICLPRLSTLTAPTDPSGAGTVAVTISGYGNNTIIATDSGLSCVLVSDDGVHGWKLQNVALRNGGIPAAPPAYCINLSGKNSSLSVSGIEYSRASTAQNRVDKNSVLEISGTNTIDSNSNFHYYATNGGVVYAVGCTYTIRNTPHYPNAFAYASENGLVKAESSTYTGSATGTRYFVQLNGLVYTGTNNATYFAGDGAGIVQLNGYYY